jgi:hypothetical protein
MWIFTPNTNKIPYHIRSQFQRTSFRRVLEPAKKANKKLFSLPPNTPASSITHAYSMQCILLACIPSNSPTQKAASLSQIPSS